MDEARACDRLSSIGRVIAATTGLSIATAPGLWWSDGWLSPVSVAGGLPSWLFRVLTVATAVCAALAALGVRPRWTMPALTIVLVLRAGPDRVLWQSYVLEWIGGAAVIAWATWREERAREGLDAIRWMLGLLFVWAGIHKVNPDFVENGIGAWMAQFDGPAPPPWVNVAFAGSEIALGIALLSPRTQRVAASALVVWSLAAAGALAVLGLNRAVVPWNVGHAAMLAVLSLPDGQRVRGWRSSAARNRAVIAVIVVAGLLPTLYPVGWPPYLAWRLYTASSMTANLYLDGRQQLPDAGRRVAQREPSETFEVGLDVQRWAHEATGAFVPPEQAVFEGILQNVCERVRDRRRVLLVMVPTSEWWDRAPETRYVRCDD